MARLPLVPSQTAAYNGGSSTVPRTESVFHLGKGHNRALLVASNLAGAEEVPLLTAAGSTWIAVTDAAGTAQKLTATIKTLTVDSPGTFGVTKPVTVGACAVHADLG